MLPYKALMHETAGASTSPTEFGNVKVLLMLTELDFCDILISDAELMRVRLSSL